MSVGLGDTVNAKRLVGKIRPDSGAQIAVMAGIAEVLALSGETGEARKIVTDLNLFAPDSPLRKYRQALLAAAFGDRERALTLLKSALEMREPDLVWIGVEPRFDSLLTEPEFKVLVKKVIPSFRSSLL
jgi:hypothetical protein